MCSDLVDEDTRTHSTRPLTPEEDSVGDPGDEDEEIDDLLPADLWFHHTAPKSHCGQSTAR
jgi:hypothetical protein